MRRYALAIPLAYLAAAVACGSFDADETGGSSSSSGGPTADASLDGQGSSGALPDGGGLPACKSSHFEDDFADAGASGWKTVSVGDAAITYPAKGVVSILLNGTEQRGYLELDQPETPCAQGWTYSLTFVVKIQDRDHAVAGPVLGGIHPGVDPGLDGMRNRFAVGFVFEQHRSVSLLLTDDACKPGNVDGRPCFLKEAVGGDGGRIALADLTDGLRKIQLRITTITAAPGPTNGYGTIRFRADDGPEKSAILPFPMQETQLRTEFGVSLSSAGSKQPLELDNAVITFEPAQ